MDATEEPQFSLLVPYQQNRPLTLMQRDDRARDHLDEAGMRDPLANIRLGGGKLAVWGLGRTPSFMRNIRAEAILRDTMRHDINIALNGPVMFVGVSGQDVMDALRVAAGALTASA